jgi:hypothetical protein
MSLYGRWQIDTEMKIGVAIMTGNIPLVGNINPQRDLEDRGSTRPHLTIEEDPLLLRKRGTDTGMIEGEKEVGKEKEVEREREVGRGRQVERETERGVETEIETGSMQTIEIGMYISFIVTLFLFLFYATYFCIICFFYIGGMYVYVLLNLYVLINTYILFAFHREHNSSRKRTYSPESSR